MIKDIKSGKSHVVDLDLIAVYPSKLRCEVTTSFGVHLASVALNEQKIAYLVTRQKKYYSGKVSASALKPVLNLSVDPRLIVQLLFDSPLPSSEWKCEGLQKDAPAHCLQVDPKLTSPLEVTWLERERARRKIQIASKDFSLTLELKGFKPNVQVPEGTFDLAQPPGFEVLSAWNRRQSPAY